MTRRLDFSLRLVHWLIAMAIVIRVSNDFMFGRYQMHDQILWSARYSGILPLGGTTTLIIEWLLLITIAGLLAFGQTTVRVWAARIGALVVLYSLTQFFQNQKLLILFALIALSFDPLRAGSTSQWNLRFLIYVAYLSASLHKILNEFYSGDALTRALESVVAMAPQLSAFDFRPIIAKSLLESDALVPLSFFTIFAQMALPLLLWKRPRIGIQAVATFHIGLSAVMPDILPFGLAMLAAAIACAPRHFAEKKPGL